MSFRIDRFATLYMFGPIRRMRFSRDNSIPILMYHSISDDTEASVHPYYRTSTSPQQFATQMQYLRDEGYKTTSLSEIHSLQPGTASHDKKVVITFDDGFANFHGEAFPTLHRFGFSATVFLPTSFISDQGTQFKGQECMTWSQVRELHGAGIVFGSHTVTHPQLRALSADEIDEEIVRSKQTIEDKLSASVDSFAYPYAFPQADHEFTTMLRDLLVRAGYRTGVCTTVGRVGGKSDRLFMERLPINSCDDAPLLDAKLAGAYDWVGKSQYISKMVKTRLQNSTKPLKRSISSNFPAVH
jgi:peptidoglycan/xylan/chitin deacetylase (PgdA/CDA1 family)